MPWEITVVAATGELVFFHAMPLCEPDKAMRVFILRLPALWTPSILGVGRRASYCCRAGAENEVKQSTWRRHKLGCLRRYFLVHDNQRAHAARVRRIPSSREGPGTVARWADVNTAACLCHEMRRLGSLVALVVVRAIGIGGVDVIITISLGPRFEPISKYGVARFREPNDWMLALGQLAGDLVVNGTRGEAAPYVSSSPANPSRIRSTGASHWATWSFSIMATSGPLGIKL